MVMGAGAMLSVFQGSQALEAVFQFQSAQPEENRQPASWLNQAPESPVTTAMLVSSLSVPRPYTNANLSCLQNSLNMQMRSTLCYPPR